MENKKDIGSIFKEKLNQLDKSPNENLWNAIEADLDKKKKRRIVLIPFWLKSTGIFSLGILFSWFIFNYLVKDENYSTSDKSEIKNSINPSVIESKLKNDVRSRFNNTHSTPKKSIYSNQNTSQEENASTLIKTTKNNNPRINTSTQNSKFITSSKKNYQKNSSKKIFAKKKRQLKNNINNQIIKENSKPSEVANPIEKENTSISENKIGTIANENPITKTDSLKSKTKNRLIEKLESKDSITTTVDENNNFNLFVYVSPTYTGINSKKSTIDSRLNNNPISSNITVSYGAYLSYEATDKWGLRFGISKSNLKVITENAPVNVPNYSNINYTENISNADIYYQSNNSESMLIIQDISYFEVPLEIQYYLRRKKIGVTAFSGFSICFLDKNSVSTETVNGYKFRIGETKNLSSNTFSLNVGIGLDYKISKKLKLNLEPVFKYHIVDYKNSGQINPYAFGIQTGLQFTIGK